MFTKKEIQKVRHESTFLPAGKRHVEHTEAATSRQGGTTTDGTCPGEDTLIQRRKQGLEWSRPRRGLRDSGKMMTWSKENTNSSELRWRLTWEIDRSLHFRLFEVGRRGAKRTRDMAASQRNIESTKEGLIVASTSGASALCLSWQNLNEPQRN